MMTTSCSSSPSPSSPSSQLPLLLLSDTAPAPPSPVPPQPRRPLPPSRAPAAPPLPHAEGAKVGTNDAAAGFSRRLLAVMGVSPAPLESADVAPPGPEPEAAWEVAGTHRRELGDGGEGCVPEEACPLPLLPLLCPLTLLLLLLVLLWLLVSALVVRGGLAGATVGHASVEGHARPAPTLVEVEAPCGGSGATRGTHTSPTMTTPHPSSGCLFPQLGAVEGACAEEEGGAGGAATVAAAVVMVVLLLLLPFFGTACHAGREGGPPTGPAGGGLARTTGAPAAALPTVGLVAAGMDAVAMAAGLDAARVALAAGVEVDAAADAGSLGMLCGRTGGREGAGTAWVAPRW